MSNNSSIRDLVDVLQRIEDKLLSVIHVKLGLIYLKWNAAMLGFMLATLILDLARVEDIVYLYAVITYWPIIMYFILFHGRPGYSRTLDTYVKIYFREKEVGREALRKYHILYSVGWVTASLLGFVLIPLL